MTGIDVNAGGSVATATTNVKGATKVKERKEEAAGASGGKELEPVTVCEIPRPKTIRDAICEYIGGGSLSVIPIDHRTKAPASALLPLDESGKPSWRQFQGKIADEETINRWTMSNAGAIAVVCGDVSGGLLVIDFDVERFYWAWRKRVGDLASGLPVQRTGSGRGFQVFLRCPKPGGNQKLAYAPDDENETGRTVAIETRGEGGYAIVPPSLHPSGGRYEMVSGHLSPIPSVSQEVAEALLQAARELDERPLTRQKMEQLKAQACCEHDRRRATQPSGGVIGAFNAAHPIEEILLKHGYTRAGDRYIRPGGKSRSISVSAGRSCHWSSNDRLCDGKLHNDMGVHDAFSVYCELEHCGDAKAAVAAAAEELGLQSTASSRDQEITITSGDHAKPITLILQYALPMMSGSSKVRITARRDDALLHEDRVDLSSDVSRNRFAKAVAKMMHNEETECAAVNRLVVRQIQNALLGRLAELRDSTAQQKGVVSPDDPARLLNSMPADVRSAAEEMLDDPDLLRLLVQDLSRLVAGERKLAATVYLIGVSRRLSKPCAGRIQGHSASGKSFVVEQVARLFPPETLVRATQMTPQALFHLPPGSLMHRWVVAGERSRQEHDAVAESGRALREMLSAGRLTKLMPVKIGNHIETVHIEQDGPIAFTESTTLTHIFGEDANRCLMLASDERERQTARVLRLTAATASGAIGAKDIDDIIQRHYAAQRIIALTAAQVVVPFAERLAETFPTSRPEARRAFGQVLSMIEAVTLLFHRQREQNDRGFFIATADDYRVARYLLSAPMSRAIGGSVSDGAQRLAQRLREWAGGIVFATSDVYGRENFSDHAIRGWLSELARIGTLEIVQLGGRGRAYTYRIARVGPPDDGSSVAPADNSLLPAVEDVIAA